MGPATATAPQLRKAIKRRSPGLAYERELWAAGHEVVVGMDEVGRGAWAGPISVGAAVLPRDRRVYKVRDSKMLTEPEREALFDRIAAWCVTWAVGHATQVECDALGMSEAQRLAARRAIDGLGRRARPGPPRRQLGLRRRWRRPHRQGRRHLPVDRRRVDPGQGHPRPHHAGRGRPTTRATTSSSTRAIPCPRHKAALKWLGPTAIHRRSWVFMDHLPWSGIPRVRPVDPQQSLFEAE